MYPGRPPYGGGVPRPYGSNYPRSPAPAYPTAYGTLNAPPRVTPPLQPGPGVPGLQPPRALTVWVGKIAPTVGNETIHALLKACGKIKEWKPVLDVDTGIMKSFGFCTFEDAAGAVTALTVLNGRAIDSQSLALKPNKATEAYLAWFKQSNPTAPAPPLQETLDEAAANASKAVDDLVGSRPSASSAVGSEAPQSSAPVGGNVPVSESRPPVDPKVAREREKLKRELQRRRELEDRAFREQLRQWEDYERQRDREAFRALERERDAKRERERATEADWRRDEFDAEPWWRHPYYTSRQAEERSKWRRLERAEDDEDRRREEEEEVAAERALKEAAEPEENEAMDVATSSVEEQPFKSETNNEPLSYEASSIVIKTAPLQRRRRVFAHEEEEDQSQRRLISIQYTEAEKKGLLEEPAAREESEPPSAPPVVESAAESRKRIMSMIPKDSDSVLEYPLEWKYLDNPPRDVSERIKAWVTKRIVELMGEDEESFVGFIMGQISDKTAASEMIAALKDVLDEDTLNFVVKLFQILIYEALKLEHGIS